jgi:hypothetical protein
LDDDDDDDDDDYRGSEKARHEERSGRRVQQLDFFFFSPPAEIKIPSTEPRVATKDQQSVEGGFFFSLGQVAATRAVRFVGLGVPAGLI